MAETAVLSETVDLAKPGESIRCLLSEKQARELAKRLYGLTVTELKELNGYDDRNFLLTVAEDYQNQYIDEIWPHGYVLKIVNTLDSKKPEYLDAQSYFMIHLDSHIPGFCPLPVKNVDGRLSSLETIHQEDGEGNRISDTPTEHIVRLLSFQPGMIFHQIPQPDLDIFYQVGQFLGKIDKACEDFSTTPRSLLEDRLHIWSMYRIPNVKQFCTAVRNPKRRLLVEEVIETFCEEVPPNYGRLPKGTVHGDYNEQNVLVSPVDTDANRSPTKDTLYKQTGVIDFGDIAYACYIFEIGMAIMYFSTCSGALDSIEVGGHILAGYLCEMTLTDLELDLLRTVVAARYAQSLVLGEYYYQLDNNEYCLTTGITGWGQLERLWATPKEKVMEIWLQIVEQRKKQKKAQ